MIKTTMAHKSGGRPGTLSHGRIVGQPSSKNVIKTTMSKTGGGADGFAYKSSGSGKIRTTVKSCC